MSDLGEASVERGFRKLGADGARGPCDGLFELNRFTMVASDALWSMKECVRAVATVKECGPWPWRSALAGGAALGR